MLGSAGSWSFVLLNRWGCDRPRAKGGGVPLASRRGCSRVGSHKKESGFGLLVSRRSRQRNSCCGTNRKKKVKKTRPDVSDRKTSPDAPGKKIGFFFGPVDPNTTRGHRQTPPNAASRSSQHAQKSPFCRRGINHRPFSSGSVLRRARSARRLHFFSSLAASSFTSLQAVTSPSSRTRTRRVATSRDGRLLPRSRPWK